MQPTLAALARRLDADTFFQVSRTAIVSLDAMREAKPFADGTGEIVLANGLTLAGRPPPLARPDGEARTVGVDDAARATCQCQCHVPVRRASALQRRPHLARPNGGLAECFDSRRFETGASLRVQSVDALVPPRSAVAGRTRQRCRSRRVDVAARSPPRAGGEAFHCARQRKAHRSIGPSPRLRNPGRAARFVDHAGRALLRPLAPAGARRRRRRDVDALDRWRSQRAGHADARRSAEDAIGHHHARRWSAPATDGRFSIRRSRAFSGRRARSARRDGPACAWPRSSSAPASSRPRAS